MSGDARTRVRRIVVVAVAAAVALPFAIPALATAGESPQQGLDAAPSPQSVTVSATAGSPQLEAQRADLYPSTQAEVQQMLDDLAPSSQDPAASAPQATQVSDLDGASTPAPVEVPEAPETSVGSVVAAAAVQDFGVEQECTELVSTALAAADIPYSGMGNLFNLGPTVAEADATAGDVVYYADGGHGAAHVAIYLGDSTAMHGGWEGGSTVIAGIDIDGSEPVYIHLG